MKLEKYTMGVGDRFARQGKAQLEAFILARQGGRQVFPVWNKSFREHSIIGSGPGDVRREADQAVRDKGWPGAYYVDADHISLKTVEAFVAPCDFFTLDVADFIGKPAAAETIEGFVNRHRQYARQLTVAGIELPLEITEGQIRIIAGNYLLAAEEAGRLYRRIELAKGRDNFVTEVSLDETDRPQTPLEMLFILAALAQEGIPAQTIAPKFTGRFNKGVDYAGDVRQFEQEFNDDLAVVQFAVKEFGLPANLKLSVHSGSDKFSLYEPIRRAIRRFDAGLHLKTAGTTWLEELIGLAESGGEGLALVREVYRQAWERAGELCGPYATVIDIDPARLPAPREVQDWDGERFAAALRHDPACGQFNGHFRQLLHVGYKVAAQMGGRYYDALKHYETEIARQVTANILQRHIEKVF